MHGKVDLKEYIHVLFFSYFSLKDSSQVLIRTTSLWWFQRAPTIYVWGRDKEILKSQSVQLTDR